MKSLFLYIKHFLIVTLILAMVGFGLLVSQKGSISFGLDSDAYRIGDEGPHIFTADGQFEALYIRGDRARGFETQRIVGNVDEHTELTVSVPFDDSTFSVTLRDNFQSPAVDYDDGEDILAISDLEGNYAAFRDFLIANQVIDEALNWTFGKGHLVLVGDMVDRGFSTTQLLWLIYKLETDAADFGGTVHYIIGNHEIKNMQGNFTSAAPKYLPIAGILGVQQYELFGSSALLGQWMQSKNVAERINGYLFVHGGLHPELVNVGYDLAALNQTIRDNYRQLYFKDPQQSDETALLTSTETGPAWYRGYFKDVLSQSQVEATLDVFNAKAVVVGHTVQFRVNHSYEGKVFAIDVKHPEDFGYNFPFKRSEGLLISNGRSYRLLDDGKKVPI